MRVKFYIFLVISLCQITKIHAQFREWTEIKPLVEGCPVYVVDSIAGTTPVEVLYDTKNWHYFGIIENNPEIKIRDRNIWKTDGMCLFLPDFFWNLSFRIKSENVIPLMDALKIWPMESRYPKVIEKSSYLKNMMTCSYTSAQPIYYLKILIQGKFYNDLTYALVFDRYNDIVKFPDELAFYPLLIPIFDD